MNASWKRILVPTDFSDASVEAVLEARRLAGDESEILLLFVVEPPFEGLRIHTSEGHDTAKREAEDRMRRFVADYFGAAANVRWKIAEGRPAETICDLAAKSGSELIVISSQGNGALGHLLVGGVTDRVVRHAPVPVLVVRCRRSAAG